MISLTDHIIQWVLLVAMYTAGCWADNRRNNRRAQRAEIAAARVAMAEAALRELAEAGRR